MIPERGFFLEGSQVLQVSSSGKSNSNNRLEVRKRKQNFSFLSTFGIISTSHKYIYIYIYIVLHTGSIFIGSESLKTKKRAFHFLRHYLYAELLLFFLTILPAESDLAWKPQTVWHLCCSLANHLEPLSLSLLQSGFSETPHKETLQTN